jgi:hypothetical protein
MVLSTKKVQPVPIEQRGKLVEFPKENFSRSLKLRTIRNAAKEARQLSFSLDVIKGINEEGYGDGI